MICPRCSTELWQGAKFCKECGAKIEPTCANCGKTIPPDSKFCPECGHDLRKSATSDCLDTTNPAAYTPKHLADKILTGKSAIEGERKLVTICSLSAPGLSSVWAWRTGHANSRQSPIGIKALLFVAGDLVTFFP